jgi:dihydropyrimidinase
MFDLVIRGGTVATPGSVMVVDIAVEGGVIAQLGGSMEGKREIDACGKEVFPGGVDMHVHLTQPREPAPGAPAWVDDFSSGSRAAIAGGVTTLGNMTFQRPGETLRQALDRDLAAAKDIASVDYVLHPALADPSAANIAQIPGLAAEGHTSLKVYMTLPQFESRAGEYLSALQVAGEHGVITMFHCEDGTIIRAASRKLLAQGSVHPSRFPETRPVSAETAAVDRAIELARSTRSPVYIVHLSSADALARCRPARAEGVPVFVETRPLYLYLTRERFDLPDGAKYVGAPPLRETADVDALWAGLASGDIDCVGTDHAPWRLEHKLDPALDATNQRQGVADLETLMPMLYSEGVRTGRISLSRFVELTSTSAARLFGLYPRKGAIAVGSDADLVIWDPAARRTVDGSRMQSKAGYSPYDGWDVQGWPESTISRGDVLLDGGRLTAMPGRGRWLPRGPVPKHLLQDASGRNVIPP